MQNIWENPWPFSFFRVFSSYKYVYRKIHCLVWEGSLSGFAILWWLKHQLILFCRQTHQVTLLLCSKYFQIFNRSIPMCSHESLNGMLISSSLKKLELWDLEVSSLFQCKLVLHLHSFTWNSWYGLTVACFEHAYCRNCDVADSSHVTNKKEEDIFALIYQLETKRKISSIQWRNRFHYNL